MASSRLTAAILIFMCAAPWMACKKAQPSVEQRAVASVTPATQTAPAVGMKPDTQASEAEREAHTNGIRSMNLNAWIETHVGELNPNLANMRCDEGKSVIDNQWATEYVDLDGDGQEEAVVQAWSCVSGRGDTKQNPDCVGYTPPDIVGVLKLLPQGKIAVLPLPETPKTFRGRRVNQDLVGFSRLNLRKGKLIEVYETAGPNGCPLGEREFVYRWDGRQFILDNVTDVADV